MRIAIAANVQVIAKDRGEILLRSDGTPLEGYRATGTEKNRFDRRLSAPTAKAFVAALGGADIDVPRVTFHDAAAVGSAIAAGYVDVAVDGTGKPGKPAAHGATLGSFVAAPADAPADAPVPTATNRRRRT
jgi:hypothetical protein